MAVTMLEVLGVSQHGRIKKMCGKKAGELSFVVFLSVTAVLLPL